MDQIFLTKFKLFTFTNPDIFFLLCTFITGHWNKMSKRMERLSCNVINEMKLFIYEFSKIPSWNAIKKRNKLNNIHLGTCLALKLNKKESSLTVFFVGLRLAVLFTERWRGAIHISAAYYSQNVYHIGLRIFNWVHSIFKHLQSSSRYRQAKWKIQ